MRLQFNAQVLTDKDRLDIAIRAVAVAEIRGDTLIYALSGAEGGISVYRLGAGGDLALLDSAFFPSDLAAIPSSEVAVAEVLGKAVLLLGAADGRLLSYELADDGSLGMMRALADLDPALGRVVQLDYLADAGGGAMLALAGRDGISALYRIDPTGDLSGPVLLSGPDVALRLIAGPDGTQVVQARLDGVQSLWVGDAATAVLRDHVGVEDGFGISAITALETVAAHGTQFVILGAAGTDSISVLELDSAGGLIPRDHLIDSLSSRFANLQDLAVARVAEQVFVVAGGSDDGLSLLILLPDGRLIHLDSIASAPDARIDGVSRLSATHAQGALQIVAATEGNPGLVHLSVPMANIGKVLRGGGMLTGGAGDDLLVAEATASVLVSGAGDDILVAGPAGTTMTGGAGRDLFVMRRGGGTVRITDFDPAEDRLDLSDYTMLRSPDQLGITPLSGGARITYRDEIIVIDSHDGTPLTREVLFGRAFEGPDRFTFLFGDRPGDTSPAPDPPPPPPSDPGRLLVISSLDANPWLAGADIMFTPDNGATISVRADAEGRFDLSALAGETGHLHILRGYSTGDPRLTVGDALDVLRLAVGLQPSFGPASDADRIAADINRNGMIGVDDALEVLRVVVGLPARSQPHWLFLDPQADLAPVLDGTAPLPEGLRLTLPETGGWDVAVTAILLGNVDGFF
ncbi:MAG: hypothetical protein ACNA7F_02425 [Roseovarius sp.]